MSRDDYKRGQQNAYWSVVEYLTAVDDRLRLRECRNVKTDRSRQIVENAIKWATKRAQEASNV